MVLSVGVFEPGAALLHARSVMFPSVAAHPARAHGKVLGVLGGTAPVGAKPARPVFHPLKVMPPPGAFVLIVHGKDFV
jgi:hypothetical protein